MLFDIKEEDQPRSGKLVYIRDEWSISFNADTDGKNADCSVLVTNLNIDFDLSTKKANDIWGYHPHTMWVPQKLRVPQYFPGSFLLLDASMSFQDIIRVEGSLEWKTCYDNQIGWLCLGNAVYEQEDIAVEFLTNVLVVLHQHQLKALWLKPVFV